MGLKNELTRLFNKHTAMSAAFTALNLAFAYMAAPSPGALLPLACAVWSANNWKQAVTGRGLW
jgi:hypothetical protein